MKAFKIFTILLFSVAISLFSCKEKNTTPKQAAPTPAIPTKAEPTQNAIGVYHYTCIKGCAGGAGSAVNCTTCGSVLVHNQAYHTNVNSGQSSAPFASPQMNPSVNSTVIPTPAEPSQNAAGVWHYTCAKGCAGGAGTGGSCASCGNALAHNAAYHQ